MFVASLHFYFFLFCFKAALKVYQAKSEEVDGLREENTKALAM